MGGRTVNYIYDDIYGLTSESIANDPHGVNGNASYSYDPVGNRLNRSSSVAPVASQSSAYDANDRLTTDIYDNNGNTTSANGNSYVYDFENHLTSLNGGNVTYLYDGDDNRVAKTVGGVTTNYLVDTKDLSPSSGTNKRANVELRIADFELVRTKSERTVNSHFAIRNPKFLSGRDSSRQNGDCQGS